MIVRFCTLVLICLLFATYAAAAGQKAGTVMSVTPGVFVERDGRKEPLETKAPVYSGDVLITDATGRLRVWMSDETTLSIGSDTEFEIEEYDDKASKPVFRSKLTGVARFLTGEITKANPEGFKVSTPQATVGVRGTILSVQSVSGKTTVFVENTLRQVVVNGTVVPSGFKGVVTGVGAAPRISPISPADRNSLGTSLSSRRAPPAPSTASRTGSPAAAASGEAPDEAGARMVAEAKVSGSDGKLDRALTEAQGGMGTDEPYIPGSDPGQSKPVFPDMAKVSGTLNGSQLFPNPQANEFSFDVNFKTGAVSNAQITLGNTMDLSGNGAFTLTGGSGSISGSNFSVNSFADTHYNYYDDGVQMQGSDVRGAMSGSVSSGSLDVSGNWNVSAKIPDGQGQVTVQDSGTLTGKGVPVN